MSEINPGAVLGGRYSLTKRLSRPGAVPERWEANDTTLKRDVTIVTFAADEPHSGAALDGARRVASTVDQRLERVLDVGQHEDIAFIVIESLANASTLGELATRGDVHPEEARRIVGEAASALESARLRGLHHVLLRPDDVRIAKDGSVSVAGVATAAALAGQDEVPAEEASKKDATGLAACLYALLTGAWPLQDKGVALPEAKRSPEGHPLSPALVAKNVPHDLDDLCHDSFTPGRKAPETPGDVARRIAPWSADPITPDVAHLRHVAAPMTSPVETPTAAVDPFGDEWGNDDAWGDDFDFEPQPVSTRPQRPFEPVYDEYGEDLPAAAEPPQRSKRQAGMALTLVLAFVAVAIVLALFGLFAMAENPFPTATKNTSSKGVSDHVGDLETPGAQSPAPTTEAPATTSAPAPGGDLKIAGASLADNSVDGGAGPISNVIDGNPATAWTSMGWQSPSRDGRAPVTVVLDLGQEQTVKKISVTFKPGTYGFTAMVGNSPNATGNTNVAETEPRAGTAWSADIKETKGRYVVLNFPEAGKPDKPAIAGYPYGVQIAEIKVSG